MIYLDSRMKVFTVDKGYRLYLDGSQELIIDNEIGHTVVLSNLPSTGLKYFKNVDIDRFIEMKSSGEADIAALEYIAKGRINGKRYEVD